MSKQKQPEQLHVIADDGLITEFKKLADENYEKYSNLLKRLMKK